MSKKSLREGGDSVEANTSRTASAHESQSQEAAHSRLPWRLAIPPPNALNVQAHVVDERGQNVLFRAAIGLRDSERYEPRHNADFIVRCVNVHDDLLAALRGIAEVAATEQPSTALSRCIATRAQAAIAKSEGR